MDWRSSSGQNIYYSYSNSKDTLTFGPSTNAAHLQQANAITIIKLVEVTKDPDQAYYWTPAWQERAKLAEQDLLFKRYAIFETMDDFIESLDDPLTDE
jgi:hypothetical protein